MDENNDKWDKLMKDFADLNKFSQDSKEAMGFIRGLMWAGKLAVMNNQVSIGRKCFDEAEKMLEKVNVEASKKMSEYKNFKNS